MDSRATAADVLSAGRGECPGCGTAARPVPDLLEEMVQRTLDDDGRVVVIRDAPFSVAAKLRFPVTAEEERTMKATETATVRVETHGRVPNGSAELAAAKVGPLLLSRRPSRSSRPGSRWRWPRTQPWRARRSPRRPST